MTECIGSFGRPHRKKCGRVQRGGFRGRAHARTTKTTKSKFLPRNGPKMDGNCGKAIVWMHWGPVWSNRLRTFTPSQPNSGAPEFWPRQTKARYFLPWLPDNMLHEVRGAFSVTTGPSSFKLAHRDMFWGMVYQIYDNRFQLPDFSFLHILRKPCAASQLIAVGFSAKLEKLI